MSEFTLAAVKTYLKLSRIALAAALIDDVEYDARIAFLRNETEDGGSILRTSSEEDSRFEESEEREARTRRSGGSQDDDKLAFRSSDPRVSEWVFRPGDPDPYPSVPHGHSHDRPQPKLDAYRGYVWLKNPQRLANRRVSRADIAALWNDQAFRTAAADALAHFIDNNPRARAILLSRGIQDPLKLPTFRRGR